MYKIIFIDIDGTLRNDKHEITERTKRAISEIVKKDIYVVICSGRPRNFTENISKEALASKYIISSNGAEIYNYKDEKIANVNYLSNEDILKLWYLSEKEDIQIIMNRGERRIVRKETDNSTDIILQEPIEECVQKNSFTQCVLASDKLDKIQRIQKKIESFKSLEIVNLSRCLSNINLPKEKPFFLDVACKGISKGNAIKQLCKYLEIDLKDSIAIGDSYNDITMLETVGYAVVMGNAPEDIKKIADEVTASNNEDGVAKFIEKFIEEVF